MSESNVLPWPVIESEAADADMLAIALDFVQCVRQGTIVGFALVTIHPENAELKTRWINTIEDRFDIYNAVTALQVDLLAERLQNGGN
jgi:acetamidase/formamidase